MIMQRFHGLRGGLMCAALGTFLTGLSSSALVVVFFVFVFLLVTAGGLSKSETQIKLCRPEIIRRSCRVAT